MNMCCGTHVRNLSDLQVQHIGCPIHAITSDDKEILHFVFTNRNISSKHSVLIEFGGGHVPLTRVYIITPRISLRFFNSTELIKNVTKLDIVYTLFQWSYFYTQIV